MSSTRSEQRGKESGRPWRLNKDAVRAERHEGNIYLVVPSQPTTEKASEAVFDGGRRQGRDSAWRGAGSKDKNVHNNVMIHID
jgi:hypothetical protein